MAGPVASALPPLLPTPAFPLTSCLVLAPPPTPYASQRDWDGKKPGRASSSQSWIRDKTGGGDGASLDESRERAKVPGRASLSENWTMDKMIGRLASNESSERVGRAPSRRSWNGGKRPASRAPSADRTDKKPKPPSETEAAEEALFAGPTFIVSPEPSELPIPSFVKAR